MPLHEKGGESPQILHLMQTLDITKAEAKDIIECDQKIDKGKKLFELSQEGKKAEREMKQTRSVDAYGKVRTREKKEDSQKQEIIKILADAIEGALDLTEMKIENKEREFTFRMDGRKFKIVLSCPRS